MNSVPARPCPTIWSALTSAAAPEAECAHLGPGDPGHGHHARVVGIEHRQAVRGQRGGQLGLRLGDALDAPGALQVSRVNGQHDTDLGVGDLGQPRDLADGVHAHLEDRRLVLGAEPEQGHRQTGLRVEVARVAKGDETPARQHIGDDLLRDRLAGRARDADHPHAVARSPPGGELLEGVERIGDHDLRSVDVGREVDGPFDERGDGAGPQRIGHVGVPIGALATQGDEDGSGGDTTGVDRSAGDLDGGVPTDEAAAGGGNQVVKADRGSLSDRGANARRV